MSSKLLSSQTLIYHLILFLSFSLSVNFFVELKYINYFAYVCFHLTLVYLIFYFFHFALFFVLFLYGIFFDFFLVNYISSHLITFLLLIFLFYLSKKYLLNFSSNKISYIIFFSTIIMFISEVFIANILFNYPIRFNNLGLLFLSTVIIFIPSLLLFDKIDKL